MLRRAVPGQAARRSGPGQPGQHVLHEQQPAVPGTRGAADARLPRRRVQGKQHLVNQRLFNKYKVIIQPFVKYSANFVFRHRQQTNL